jgi:hypothetical protein
MRTRPNKDSKINPIHGEDFDVEVYQKSVITKLLQCKDEESQSELIDELTYATTCNKNGWATIRTPFSKEEDIVVGAKFYYENDMMGMSCDVRLMTITYLRSGIAFYTDDKDDTERSFPIGCFFASRLEPEEYIAPKGYPSKWYKFESFYGETKIIYNE